MYQFTALLYLNTHGKDFDGGRFIFRDADADRVVLPKAGRLLTMTGGPENYHLVEQVTRGTRFALTILYECPRGDRDSAVAAADSAATAERTAASAAGLDICHPFAHTSSADAALLSAALVSLMGQDPRRETLLNAAEKGESLVTALYELTGGYCRVAWA